MHPQPRVLIRVTSVPSLICSGLVLGSRSKPGLKAPAWAWFCSGNFLHYINIWYPRTADTISPPPAPLILKRPPPARLSSRWCRNSGQSDKSRSENRRGRSCPAMVERWRESQAWLEAARVRTKLVETWKKTVSFSYSCLNKTHFRCYSGFNQQTPFRTHLLFFSDIWR